MLSLNVSGASDGAASVGDASEKTRESKPPSCEEICRAMERRECYDDLAAWVETCRAANLAAFIATHGKKIEFRSAVGAQLECAANFISEIGSVTTFQFIAEELKIFSAISIHRTYTIQAVCARGHLPLLEYVIDHFGLNMSDLVHHSAMFVALQHDCHDIASYLAEHFGEGLYRHLRAGLSESVLSMLDGAAAHAALIKPARGAY